MTEPLLDAGKRNYVVIPKDPLEGLHVGATHVYWRAPDRTPLPVMRRVLDGSAPAEAFTPEGEWPLDSTLANEVLYYTASPSGDPTLSDCRLVAVDASGARVIADGLWQAAAPRVVGSDLFWITGLNDTRLAGTVGPAKWARIHRRTAAGVVSTFDHILGFSTWVVVPDGIVSTDIGLKHLSLHDLQGAKPVTELYAAERIDEPVADEEGAVYVATAPAMFGKATRIVRISQGKAEEIVAGDEGYEGLVVWRGRLYWSQHGKICRRSVHGGAVETLFDVGARVKGFAVGEGGIAWWIGGAGSYYAYALPVDWSKLGASR